MPNKFSLDNIRMHGELGGENLEFSSTDISPEMVERGKREYLIKKMDLIKRSMNLQGEGRSYRGFRVGAAVLMDNPKYKERYHVESSHNWKPIKHDQTGWDKLCAETSVLNIALHDGANYIPALATVCNRLDIGDENRSEKTLHPCQNCRNLFRELLREGKMSDDTIILTVNNGKPWQEKMSGDAREVGYKPEEISDLKIAELPMEELSLKELLDLYKDDKPYRSEDFGD